MNLLQNIRIGPRLTVLLAAVIALMCIIAFIGLWNLAALVKQSEDTFRENIVPKGQLAELVNDYAEARTQILLALQHAPDGPFLAKKTRDRPRFRGFRWVCETSSFNPASRY